MENSSLLFGKYVKQRREEIGKTLRGFAAEVKISPAYLSDIENGRRNAPEKFLKNFSEALNITGTEELHKFYDLAGVSQNGQHSDINEYIDSVPKARVALRTAQDNNYNDEDWQKLIEIIKNKNT